MARKTNNKPEPIIVAIIGEGITEWHYFNDLKQTEKYFKKCKIYQTLTNLGNLNLAIANATRLLSEVHDNENELFPYSEIHLLLDNLKIQNM